METRAEGLYQCGEAGDKLIHRADLRAVRDPVVLEHPSGYRHSARWSARFSTSTTPVKVRNSSLRGEAVRHAEAEREWIRRRVKYRRVLAGMTSQGPVRDFLFRSVPYESPAHWEKAMEEIIAYHAGSKRDYERAAGRPWESFASAASPQALSNHVEVETKIAEIIRNEREAASGRPDRSP